MESLRTYLIHTCYICEIARGIVLCGNEYTVALSCSNIYHICCCFIRIYTIDFNDLHSMALEPDVLASECTYIDDSEHVRLPRLDCSGKILAVIEKGSFGNWLCSSRVGHTDETLQKNWHLLMIPI